MNHSILTVLISGTSHIGKSTLARSIGGSLDWKVLSTDSLARHPGRPWPNPKPHVAEFYAKISSENIYQFLLHHHENMWPSICHVISDHHQKDIPLVLEGSALRPEFVAKADFEGVRSIYLYSDDNLIIERIRSESNYAQLDKQHKAIVDKFTERTLLDNHKVKKSANDHKLFCVDARDADTITEFIAGLVSQVKAMNR